MCQKFAGRKGKTRCKRCPIRYNCIDHKGRKGKDRHGKSYSDTEHKGQFRDEKY